MEQLHEFQKTDFSHHLDQQIVSGSEPEQGHTHVAANKKSELEGYIRKRLSTLKAEEVMLCFNPACLISDLIL